MQNYRVAAVSTTAQFRVKAGGELRVAQPASDHAKIVVGLPNARIDLDGPE
jgi:hypothetical protein